MKKTFSLILALVLTLGLLPRVALPVQAADVMDTMCYDDHVDMTGKQVQIINAGSYGNGTVVALSGNYLVATGIGTATVRINGTIHQITVTKAKINLIMIMGQSNSGNHFENATSDVTCPVGTAYWWGNDLGTDATEPVPYTEPSMGFHAPLLAELYAQSVAAGDPVKNVLIWHEGITSKDGQSIVKWAASATNTRGTDDSVTMLEMCRAYYLARSDRYEIVSNGVYWLQGESDTKMDPALYTQRFMAMWQRLKDAGMEYLAFLRVRRDVSDMPENRDDLGHTASLSAQIKMINENPEMYMATTLTENWVGKYNVSHTVDISKYITVMQAYGREATYSDIYGNTATYSNGRLTTNMKALYGSNNTCHYGKFGYGLIGADAAYNMYKALNQQEAAIVVTDTSGYANRVHVLSDGQSLALDITNMTDNLSFRADCGSTAGTLQFAVRSGATDITNRSGLIVNSGSTYGSVNISTLRKYTSVSILITYTTVEGKSHTVLCRLQSSAVEPTKDYTWDFNEDLKARSEDGEVLNSFLDKAVAGSYTLSGGYLNAKGLQLELENLIELYATNDWTIEWKYGAMTNGTAGFLLCQNKGNTVGNKAIWHIYKGNMAIANYLDSAGYRNYTDDAVILKAYDRVKMSNSYDPVTGKSTISLWINDELKIADFQQKGSINGYDSNSDMTGHPLDADFSFRYMGNNGMSDWYVNCQLDYLKISFGETLPQAETYYLVGYINGTDYGCEGDFQNMGQYKFVDGQLTTTFASDSYVFLKTEGNGKWLMADAYCEDRTCTFLEGGSEKLKVPGNVAITFTLEENADGSVTLSYVTAADNCSHSYNTQITIPTTCNTAGERTYTCSKCGHRYVETIAPPGHDYVWGNCTVCGITKPEYYLVGHINGADYGCENDWKNMGQYHFEDGTLKTNFLTDSYVFLKTQDNGKWLLADVYSEDTTCTFREGGSEKLKVPGNVELTFTLVENPDGTVTLSYVCGDPVSSTVPTLKAKYPSVSFEDEVIMNVYYSAENIQDVTDMGLVVYYSSTTVANVATADAVTSGYVFHEDSGFYVVNTPGIAAKCLGDTLYFAVYAKLFDGSYAYSKVVSYSPSTYAYSQLNSSVDTMKPLVVAMLNYGAEAQKFFGYNTSNLVNKNLSADQKALVKAYSADMVSSYPSVGNKNIGEFAKTSTGFAAKYPTVSFEGAFSINYYCVPNQTVKGDISLYVWNERDFTAATQLTRNNATLVIDLVNDGTKYAAVVEGIAAKNLDKGVYVAFVYSDGSATYCSGVLAYSIAAYNLTLVSANNEQTAFAKATAVYGYYAKLLLPKD